MAINPKQENKCRRCGKIIHIPPLCRSCEDKEKELNKTGGK